MEHATVQNSAGKGSLTVVTVKLMESHLKLLFQSSDLNAVTMHQNIGGKQKGIGKKMSFGLSAERLTEVCCVISPFIRQKFTTIRVIKNTLNKFELA